MLAYLKMLAVNRLAGLRTQSGGEKPVSKAKTVWKWIGIGVLTLYVYAVVVFLEMMLYKVGAEFGEPQLIIAVAFFGCTIVTLFYSFFYVVGILFFGKDTTFLGALPITSRGILSAKLLIVLAGEVGLTLLIAAPLLIRYGVANGAGVGFYLRAIVGSVFVPFAPVALSTLLSCLLIRVSALWKRRESVTVIFCFLLMAGVMALQMNLSMSAATSDVKAMVIALLFGQGSITDVILKVYPPLRWLFEGIMGAGALSWGKIALFAAVSAAAVALVVWAFGGSYMRLALKQQESIRRANNVSRKLKADKVKTPFASLLRQELREVITVPAYATNCLTGCVMFPVIIVFMLINMRGQIPGGDVAAALLGEVPGTILTSIICGALCLTTIMGQAGATAVSREGKRHDMRKTFPISGFTQLSAKLVMSMIYNFVGSMFCAIALWVMLPSLWMQTLIGLAVSQVFSLLFNTLSLILDVYHPRLNWKNETEAVKQNMNTLFSMLIGLGLAAALVGVYMLLLWIGATAIIALCVTIAVLVAAALLTLKWLSGKASVVYFIK